MLEHLGFGLVMVGCMLYVTMSPEGEVSPDRKRPDPNQ